MIRASLTRVVMGGPAHWMTAVPLLFENLTRFLKARRRAAASGVLLIGFTAALLIYLNAPPPGDLSEQRPEDSKQYLRQMEMYGGKANVLASEIRERFARLWRGRALAFTVAGLSGLLALAVLIALTPLPSAANPGWTLRGDQSKPDS
jgi:hypothetical protein